MIWFLVILFVILGIGIQKFKWYFLINGYNTMSEEEKENVEVEKLAKVVASTLYLLATIFAITYALGNKIPQLEYILPVAIIGVIIWAVFKSSKYDKNKRDKGEIIGTSLVIIIPVIIVGVVLAYTLKPVKVDLEGNKLNLNGQVINVEKIESVKLLNEYPSMKKLIGGSMGYNKNGTFNVEGIGTCKVYTSSDETPLLEVKANNTTYIVNSKDSEKIDNIYKKLSSSIEK